MLEDNEKKYVRKRNGKVCPFEWSKIKNAVANAFISNDCEDGFELYWNEGLEEEIKNQVEQNIPDNGIIDVECIQDAIERALFNQVPFEIAKSYVIYREKHKDLRFIKERLDYMDAYETSGENAATSSETDANANVAIKNVANLDGEVYKTLNRQLQRYRMRKRLERDFPEVSRQYEQDLENHIFYCHDESSSPSVKNYCEAVTLYPLLVDGTKGMDGLGTTAPHNLSSFCGQLVNLTFLLSAQCKGAVAFGEFFNFLDYFCAKDFGEDYHLIAHKVFASEKPKRRIIEAIHQAYQQIIYGWNQPAGNRSYQSPFTNISYYDSNYWHAMFSDFYFPDGTQPVWERVDFLQKDFMQWFNKERSKTLLTFPVETMALLSDGKDIIDQDYKKFTNKMYAEGHSFFTYISDNPDSLASCCRLRNKIQDNTFSFTNGLTGVQTGSVNVITLNLNRIIQNYFRETRNLYSDVPLEENRDWTKDELQTKFKDYFIGLLDRTYKYHIAYKSLIYDVEKHGMLNASTAGYISMNKLYSTIGLNGINEMAEFLGLKCSYNEDYKWLVQLVTGIISEQNKIHSKKDYLFNTEFVPAEGLSSKNYNWDKNDGYWVPDNRNLYNSYFYLADDPNTSVLDKFRLHGREFTKLLDGGVGLHCNLDEHLSEKQYSKLMDFAIQEGTSYYTFNIRNTQCDDCGHISKSYFEKCPICGSENTTAWTRVIGFLRPIKCFDKERYKEAQRRVYSQKDSVVM